ncbi:Putative porin [Methylomagnum ishizawai]|uniref:Porin n=1 Tax=Methylomagnum ishizawai TaxID=1760988 RepID=A0A1Y6D2P4_9GAMM|nr:putative porin [Methylomagnum ishizawai]SMF95133.1 Putative porin [Methylomagnum ishizawai]
MKTARTTFAALLAGSSLAGVQAAEDREATLVNRNMTVNLIEALVQKGILDRASADAMIQDAQAKAVKEAKAELAQEAAQAKAHPPEPAAPAQNVKGKDIHVGYVPEFVKKEIHDQVRAELKDEVLKDVKKTAKAEQWNFADAIPDWVHRIKPYMDARLRFSDEFFPAGNAQFYDWQAINRDGGISQALAKNDAYFNSTIDRARINERFRVGFDAQITEGLKAGFRLTTTNIYSPVSTNQTLGDYNSAWIVALDRAFLQYDYVDGQGNDWLTLWGGRIPNPFMSTEMLYSAMLSFEGLVGTARWRFGQDDPTVSSYHAPLATGRYGINLGPQTPNTIFATAGVLPLQEVNFSSADKWLFAFQAGADWLPFQDSRLKLAAAYYDFSNVRAVRNSLDSDQYDWTAPQFMQKGNTLVAINDAKNQTACNTGALGAQNVCLVGLASNFQVMDITAAFDYAGFAPTHVLLTADYAKNFGFDSAYIASEFGDSYQPHTNAYMVRLDVGRPELKRFNDWNLFFSYRYIESDAILDAFNDPIFHEGGTNAKGWTVGAQYGLATNTWVDLRWLSSDAVSGPPLSIDTLNLDLNAKF